MTSLLPFQTDDIVQWSGQLGAVVEIRGDRVVVVTDDGVIRITTQDRLREQQAVRRGAA